MQRGLSEYRSQIDYESVVAERLRRVGFLDRPHWQPLHELLKILPTCSTLDRRGSTVDVDFSLPAVTISCRDKLTASEQGDLNDAARRLMPWRKGPFSLFGLEIDAEWRSDLKWARLKPHLELKGKKVADVGSGNGYYMFRALAEEPAVVIGFDPAESFYQTFRFIQHFVQEPRLHFEMLGVEHLNWFPEFFDTVICMGVLYHQRDPLEMLRFLHQGLTPGGTVVVETLGVDRPDDWALMPEGRYGKMKNVFYLPSPTCLIKWMAEIGFVDMEVISAARTTVAEQRKTSWMVFESLADFLDPNDQSKTIEGDPAPWRFMVKAKKVR